MKKEFQLTEDDMKEYFEAIKPDPVLYGSGGVPFFRTQQEKANDEWRRFGKKYGFVWDTVQPIQGKGQDWFSAEVS